MRHLFTTLFTCLFLLSACQSSTPTDTFLVSLIADGRERTFQLTDSMTVEQFLAQSDINVQIGETDRLTPPRFTQLSDGMRITIVRVTEESECEETTIPFTREVIQNEGLQPDEERIIQIGQNGTQQICYRVIIEDGLRRDRLPVGEPAVLTAPINEVVMVGISADTDPVTINGTLTYINNKNAWVITGSSTTKRPITTTSNLDSLVLDLSDDGRYLLYTADVIGDDSFVNQLWLVDIATEQSVQLVPTNVLYAEWIPQRANEISYSTSEPQSLFPYWRALNNVLTMEIDPTSGQSLNNSIVVQESSGGLSGWWGTVYSWSPDGTRLAWVRADGMGIVDPEGNLQSYAQYALFRTNQNWSWRANISWSPDSNLVTTTLHGAPLVNEPPEASPVFDTVAIDLNNNFTAQIYGSAGIWSSPKFSPLLNNPTSQFPQGYVAYLQAREPYNSISGEYDLVVADRDGSNARVIFPPSDRVGIKTKDFGITPQDFTWSPDGRQIAVIYEGNLWIVDVITEVAYQLTFDGQSENPVWTN
jgi:resuscitation-promoting factor RpfB